MSTLTMDQIEEQVRSVARRCRGPLPEDARERVNEALASGDTDHARRLDRDNREGCGYDFNEIVLEGPFDGQEHPYECPECGLEGVYTAPAFNVVEDG